MELAIVFVIGAILGFIMGKTIRSHKTDGVLRIDTSDPIDGPYLFVELSSDVAHIHDCKKYVTFEVNTKSYLSQE